MLTRSASGAEVSGVSCCKLPEQPPRRKQQPRHGMGWDGTWWVCFSLWLPWTYFLTVAGGCTLCPAPAPSPPAAPALEPEFFDVSLVSLVVFLCPGLDWKGRRGGKPNEPFRLFEMLRWEQEEQSSPTTELNRRKIHQNFLYCLFLLLNLRTRSRGLGDNGGN